MEDHYFSRLLEWAARQTDLRQPSPDELKLFAEARAAGATFPTHLWEAYFGGSKTRLPLQFEGTYVGSRQDLTASCHDQAKRRDDFLNRMLSGGDLHETVVAIQGALA